MKNCKQFDVIIENHTITIFQSYPLVQKGKHPYSYFIFLYDDKEQLLDFHIMNGVYKAYKYIYFLFNKHKLKDIILLGQITNALKSMEAKK